MESQESPSQHFRAMTELAVDLRTLPAQILERKGIAFPAAAFVSLARIPPAGRGDSAVE